MAMLEEELDTLAKNLASSAEQCKVKRQRATSSKRKRALDVTVAEVLSEAKKLERRGKHTKKKGILPSTSRSSSYYYGPSGKIIAKTVNLRKSKTKVHTTSSGSSKSFELLDSGTLRTIEDCQVDFAGAGKVFLQAVQSCLFFCHADFFYSQVVTLTWLKIINHQLPVLLMVLTLSTITLKMVSNSTMQWKWICLLLCNMKVWFYIQL